MIDLDEALSQTRRTLRAEAARVADTEATLSAVRSGLVASATRPPNRVRILSLAAAAILVVVGLVAVSWVTSDDTDPTGPDPSFTPPPTATVPPTAAPTSPSTVTSTVTSPGTVPATQPATTTAPPLPIPVGSILDNFFVDPDHGWLTQTTPDGSTETLQTFDGGGNWVPVASMPDGVTKVRFAADMTNGWAFNDTTLWSTHDGGVTWNELPPVGGQFGGPRAVAVAGNLAYVAVANDDGVELDHTAVTADDLTSTGIGFAYGAGPVMDISLVTQPDGVWMIYNDRTVNGSARIVGGVIHPTWRPPADDQGGDVHVFADGSGGPIYALANTGIWAGDIENPRSILFVSDDRGETFRDATPPALADLPPAFSVALAGPSDIVVVTPWGDAGTTVLHSGDEGSTWSEVANIPGVIMQATQFVTATVGLATINAIDDGHQELWRTDDGGATWRPIAIGTT